MRSFFIDIFRRNIYLLLAAFVLFISGYFLNLYFSSDASVSVLRNSIQSFLQQRENDFTRTAKDTAYIHRLAANRYSKTDLEKILKKEYGVFLYKVDSTGNAATLAFWSDQRSMPSAAILTGADGSGFVQLSNGQYDYIRTTIPADTGRPLIALALIPIRWQYFISATNLNPEFVDISSAEDRVQIVTDATDFPVLDYKDNILFYLQKKPNYHASAHNWPIPLVILLGTFLVLIIIHNISHTIRERWGAAWGIGFLVSVILLLRIMIYVSPGILNLRQFELFDPSIYSSSFVLKSLGDLLINSFLFCWIILFVRRELSDYTIPQSIHRWKNWVWIAIGLALLVVTTFEFANIVQSLVMDAKISFNVTNFFSLLNNYSFIGFLALAALALGYFFLSQVLFQLIGYLIRSLSIVLYILIATMGLLVLTFIPNPYTVELDILVLIWLLAYTWLMQRRIFFDLRFRFNVSEVLFWLFIFSTSISAVILFENRKIEDETRRNIADNLGDRADPANEHVVSIVFNYIDNDFLVGNFSRFRDPVSNILMKDSMINRNFTLYQANFDTRIYTYDGDEKPLFNDPPISYDTLNTIFTVLGKATDVPDLKYYSRSFDKYTFIYRKEVRNDTTGRMAGYLFILAEPKTYKGDDALVPELFRQKTENLQRTENLPEYYAIYKNRELVTENSDYPFSTRLTDQQIPAADYAHVKKDGFDELWHRVRDDDYVVVVKRDNSSLEDVTLFAYLFSAFLFLVALFRLAALLIWSRLHWSQLKTYWQMNIRSQIHTTIIFISLFSFIVIGVATILFFIARYDRNNRDRLSKAMQIMVSEVQTKLSDQGGTYEGKLYYQGSRAQLQKLIEDIAQTHATDINIYDLNGSLEVSSNLFVYNKGILNKKMHPLAYYNLHDLNTIQFANDEHLGGVPYLSVYRPLRDESGDAYAYLNIPSFTAQDELKEEISNFLVTIINLNAFIFLIAGTIALFLTNRITISFLLISKKMQEINLGKTNEVIEWNRNDEIGGLVKEYNKMVKKLEESALALAKSEREGAWREMARQVAHEIKNPLTPMKLSIQYLQKAIDNNSLNVKEMAASVARTLVEQIDHLSKIASDFAQFANIGNPKKEVFDLHEMLYSLVSLYETTENLLFKWVPVHHRITVFADKTQLNRLFTNLLQNALEACVNRTRRVISVSEEVREDSIVVKVTDNGEGIPLEMQSKIFIPNFTTKSSGTGLGLAMSKTIVEQAKGKIWFDTVEGEGTTFYVELPILRATQTAATPPTPAAAS
ncbi:MAG TPA: HAMP domain-containing sensor histidine kinase [Puia sp.]|nr:HAMP domain-containing sensor histidine kinase [Puia sp.]